MTDAGTLPEDRPVDVLTRPSAPDLLAKFDGLIAIPLGAFDDPYFAAPVFSVWEQRKHDWVHIVGDVEHSD